MIGFDTGGNVIGGPGHIEGGMDWGLGPEGSEGGRVGHSERKAGEDRDVSPLGQKQAFMASNPLGQPSNIFATKSPTQPVGNISYYLDDETVLDKRKSPVAVRNAPLSSWAYGQTPTPHMSNKAVTQKVLDEAFKSGDMNAFMVAGLKMGKQPGELARIVGTRKGPQGTYQSLGDETSINYAMENPEWGETAFHELAGHRLINNLPGDFYDQQMPSIQALYETGGSQIAPAHVAPYGFDPTQGEMVTSRAAQVRDLFELNAPVYADSDDLYGGMGWSRFVDHMEKNPLPSWSGEGEFDTELAKQYENVSRLNQELFGSSEGGDPQSPLNTKMMAMDYGNVPAGEEMWLGDKWEGLFNNPLVSDHFLVDRLLARNPELVRSEMKSVVENEYNAALANPSSMLNKISKLGLAEKFWDYVEEFISTESEDWSPSKAKAEIQRLLTGDS